MFLQSLQLRNVRSIKALDLSFLQEADATAPAAPDRTRKWTILLGENGTGKSTILRAIALLVSGSDALPELLVKPEAWIRAGAEHCEIRAELLTADGKQRSLQLRFARGQNLREIYEQNADSMGEIDAALSHSMTNYLTLGYGATRRLAGNVSNVFRDAHSHPRAQNVATLFSADAVLNPLDTWAMNMEYRHEAAGLDVVRDAFADLLPGITLSHIDRKNQELLFQTPDGILPLAQLSDGYQNMAGWCGDLLYRITEAHNNYRNPLSARGLLLIDEIDLHLHPVWQRLLRKFLDEKLPHFQILATTHSPLTAQQSGEGELYFLQRHQGQGPAVLERYAGSPDRLMLNQLITSPAFGLDTTASSLVEEMRREYKALKERSSLSVREKRRLSALRGMLEDLPDRSAETEAERTQKALLAEIKSALKP